MTTSPLHNRYVMSTSFVFPAPSDPWAAHISAYLECRGASSPYRPFLYIVLICSQLLRDLLTTMSMSAANPVWSVPWTSVCRPPSTLHSRRSCQCWSCDVDAAIRSAQHYRNRCGYAKAYREMRTQGKESSQICVSARTPLRCSKR